MLKVLNPQLAGQRCNIGSKTYQFDSDGYADIDEDCGLFDEKGNARSPGFKLVDGSPTAIGVGGQAMRKEGPTVTFSGPEYLKNAACNCPDGVSRTFNGASPPTVEAPDDCGLAEVPGYTIVSEPPVKPEPVPEPEPGVEPEEEDEPEEEPAVPGEEVPPRRRRGRPPKDRSILSGEDPRERERAVDAAIKAMGE